MWREAEEFLSKDRYLGLLVKRHGPCQIKIRHRSNYFEDLVDAIASQQLSGKAAATIFARVKKACGGKVEPGKLKELKTENLRSCGLSYAKCSYIQDLAERTMDGRLNTEELDELPDGEVRRELVAIKGVGDWTVDMFLMFTLGRSDIFPIGDLGIRNGLKKLLKKELTEGEMVEFAGRWAPYRTVASWYIWKLLDS